MPLSVRIRRPYEKSFLINLGRQRFKHIKLQHLMKELLYQEEHLFCSNYNQGSPSLIECVDIASRKEWEGRTTDKEIVFVLKGSMKISYGFVLDLPVSEKSMILLTPGCRFTAWTGKGVSLMIMRFPEAIYFFDKQHLEDINYENPCLENSLQPLEIKPAIQSFISFLIDTLSDGLRCKHYCELKTKELFYLFQIYYTKEELAIFFRPLLTTDAQFAEFVLTNYHKVKTVNQFASLSSCSLSNFDKKFRRAFGTSAYQWMMQKRNERVFHEINTTNKPFLQIAEEQGFSSNSQFTDYCKKHLGGSPGEIRRRRYADTHKFARQKEQL